MTEPLLEHAAAARGGMRAYALTLVGLDIVAGWTIVGLISVMVAVVSAQVLLRYALNSSIGWADELSRFTFVWSMFLAIPLGIRSGVHIGMEILTSRFPEHVQQLLARLMAAIAAGLMALVTFESARMAWDQWDESMASMEASAAWFIVAVAVGCGHSALHLVWIALTGKPRSAGPVATE
jgi:TRAP-type C4-dicarboxylate transport system permease small subunit